MNLIIRAGLICYYDFLLFGLLQLENLSFSITYEIINAVISMICMLLSIIMMISCIIYIKDQFYKCPDTNHSSTLLQEFTFKERFHDLYYCIYLSKRAISACSLILIQSYPIAQIIIIGLCIILEITYLLKFKPYIIPSLTYFSVISELCQLIIVICIALFLINPDQKTEMILWWISFVSF